MDAMTCRWWLVYDGFPFWVLDMETPIVPRPAPEIRRAPTFSRSRIADLLAKAR